MGFSPSLNQGLTSSRDLLRVTRSNRERVVKITFGLIEVDQLKIYFLDFADGTAEYSLNGTILEIRPENADDLSLLDFFGSIPSGMKMDLSSAQQDLASDAPALSEPSAELILDPSSSSVSGTVNQQTPVFSGPGTDYTNELGLLPASTQVTVLGQTEMEDIVWVQIEFLFETSQVRGYIEKRCVDFTGSVPLESDTMSFDLISAPTKIFYGPGESYPTRVQTLSEGAYCLVCSTEGSWALCVLLEGDSFIRGYIPLDCLTYLPYVVEN